MSFSYSDRTLWLDDLVATLEPGTGVELCSRHADSRTAPVGWNIDDRRRAGDRHLFVALDVA